MPSHMASLSHAYHSRVIRCHQRRGLHNYVKNCWLSAILEFSKFPEVQNCTYIQQLFFIFKFYFKSPDVLKLSMRINACG